MEALTELTETLTEYRTDQQREPAVEKFYIVLWHHRHGADTAIMAATELPTPEQAAEAFNWCYEPNLGEYMDIYQVDEVRTADGTIRNLYEIPAIIVYTEGAVVHGVVSSHPIDLTVLDADTEGCEELPSFAENIVKIGDACLRHMPQLATVNPDRVELTLGVIEQRLKERSENQ